MNILNKYLGSLPPFLDKRKSHLINDDIDHLQWEVNTCYLLTCNHSSILNMLDGNLLEIEKKTTPLVIKINDELVSPSICLPLSLRKNEHFWFIAAYPDVINYFYPIIDYSARDENQAKQEYEKLKKECEQDFQKIEQIATNDYGENINATDLFLLMKDFYKNNLKKKLLLCK